MIATNTATIGTFTATANFMAIVGTTYQIALDGFNAATGNVTMTVSMPTNFALGNPFRATNNLFHLTVLGSPGQVLRIDGTTNFTTWVPITTVSNVTGTLDVIDPDSTNYATRFYRAVLP
jgi:hypothetical protein